ncbi:MAG: hypothetical protein Q9205_006907 [Flavoplaca limonia]
MAFGFGVGDIITLTKIIVTTVRDIYEAPKELQALADQAELVETTLESVGEIPPSEAAGNMRNFIRRKDRVLSVLKKMRDIVIKYRDNEGGVNPFNKILYGVWEKRGVSELIVELKERTDDLTTFLIMQTWALTKEIRPLIDQILTNTRREQEDTKVPSPSENTNAIGRRGSHDATNTQTTVSKQIDKVQAVLDHVLETDGPSDPVLLPDREDVSLEREIEIKLGQEGIGSAFTEALIEVIDRKRKQLAHPEDIDPISYTGGKNLLSVPKGWIMVVDSYNEVRSIIAQTYLEFVRVWTVNNSGEWLFNRVESAGVQIETKFFRRSLKTQSKSLVKGGNAPESAALRAISGKESYFRSEEKNDILARIAEHRSRGIDNWHFRKYEYMLCFDQSVYKTLTTLAKCCKKKYGDMPSYANLSKIILLKDIRLKAAAADLSANETSRLVDSIKDGIKEFLDKEYHWKTPPLSITDGPLRTKQIVLRRINVKLSPAEKEITLNDIAARTDCRIRVTDEKFDSQLISITGRKEALAYASLLIKEALH